MSAGGTFDAIDTSEWPVVCVTISHPPVNMEEIDFFQAKFIALLHLARHGADGVPPEPLCLMMTMDGILNATMEQQLRAASFIREVKEYVTDTIFCTALVVRSPLVCMILEFVTTLQPLQSLHKMFEGEDEALAWCRMNRERQERGESPMYE